MITNSKGINAVREHYKNVKLQRAEAFFIVRLAHGDATVADLIDATGTTAKNPEQVMAVLKSQLVKRGFKFWTHGNQLRLDELQAACVRAAYDGGCDAG